MTCDQENIKAWVIIFYIISLLIKPEELSLKIKSNSIHWHIINKTWYTYLNSSAVKRVHRDKRDSWNPDDVQEKHSLYKKKGLQHFNLVQIYFNGHYALKKISLQEEKLITLDTVVLSKCTSALYLIRSRWQILSVSPTPVENLTSCCCCW